MGVCGKHTRESDISQDNRFYLDWVYCGNILCSGGGQDYIFVKLHITPTYSSWMNPVEIWFARIERDVIARAVFTSVQDLARKLMRYIRASSKVAQPFHWKYSDVTKRIRPC
jgi:transposase